MNKIKITIGDKIIEKEISDERLEEIEAFFNHLTDEKDSLRDKLEPKLIGLLNKKWGLKGYKPAEVGHKVYEKGDRYVLILESESDFPVALVPFYKETLHNAINFI